MTQKSRNIISIGINRQRVGIAVFTNGELEYVTGRALPADVARAGRRKLLADIDDLVRNHSIGIVTMPRLTVQQRDSSAVIRAYKRIQVRVLRSGLTLVIDGSLGRKPNGTKTEETLAAVYPELRRYLGDAAWERRYYKHIFKAVSAGVALLSVKENERMTNDR
jgi:hypothetical protein